MLSECALDSSKCNTLVQEHNKFESASTMRDLSPVFHLPSTPSSYQHAENIQCQKSAISVDVGNENSLSTYAPEILSEQIDSDKNADLSSDTTTRLLPTIKAFSAQCSSCLKWRLIPTKELYEEIRQTVTENPFFCSRASSWRPQASCNDPSDLAQDASLLWAIDKPDIPRAPQGWERLLCFRGVGSGKFADVYYRSPTGRRLRSMRDVERFLTEHPEYTRAGVNKSQFSFVKPKPLHPIYIKKRSLETRREMRGSITHKKPCIDKASEVSSAVDKE